MKSLSVRISFTVKEFTETDILEIFREGFEFTETIKPRGHVWPLVTLQGSLDLPRSVPYPINCGALFTF